MSKQYYGTGRRKTSTARVYLRPTKNGGSIVVNRQPIDEYFTREALKLIIRQPLELIEQELNIPTTSSYDILVNVKGGGKAGQAGAIRLGISRALYHWAATEYGAIVDFNDLDASSQTTKILERLEKYGTGFGTHLLKWEDELQNNESFLRFRTVLRKHGFLTRDSRKVERKKYGQPGARKRFQFSKR
jgi:small subunit ribosomal protein S9